MGLGSCHFGGCCEVRLKDKKPCKHGCLESDSNGSNTDGYQSSDSDRNVQKRQDFQQSIDYHN